MKFILLLTIYFCNIYFTLAQSDTMFVNENGTIVSKSTAKFYRIISSSSNNLFLFNDYYFNHQLARSTEYSSVNGTIKEGFFFEFDTIGNKIVEGKYHKGFEIGEWNFFYTPLKNLKEKRIYNNDVKHEYLSFRYDSINGKLNSEGIINELGKKKGTWKTYFFDTNIIQYQNQYANGRKCEEQIEYYISGAIKRKEFYGKYKMEKGVLYNEKGEKIKYYPAFEYPTSKIKLKEHLQKKCICFNEFLKINNIEISFWVEKNGKLNNIQLNIDDKNCREEIKQEILKMNWHPAKKENIPIDFKVKQYFFSDGTTEN